MFGFFLMIQVLLGMALIGLILMQHGKGADMGAAFGSGSSGTMFGSRGSGSFLTRITAILAFLFFCNSLFLSSPLVRDDGDGTRSVAEQIVPVVTEEAAPVEEAAPADLPDLPAADETPAPVSDLPE